MKCVLFIPLALAVALTGTRAAPFQNLDFESGSFVPIPTGLPRIYFDQAFPGWTGYIGGVPEPTAFSNAICLSACPQFVLVDQSSVIPPIDGLTALLHAGLRGSDPVNVTIAQMGMVPSDAQSLQFRAQTYGGPFEVELGGQPLSLMPLATTSEYVMFGADISAWAGQESELRFTAVPGDNPTTGGRIFTLDSIQFSTTPVPEPSTFALLAVGGMFGWFCWRCKRR
jgi:hypothetical protein